MVRGECFTIPFNVAVPGFKGMVIVMPERVPVFKNQFSFSCGRRGSLCTRYHSECAHSRAGYSTYVLFARTAAKKYYAACLIAYLLALLSKPTSSFLPFVMLLMDYWPLNRLSRKSLLEKLPFFALLIVFAVITFVSQLSGAGGLLPGQEQHSLLNPPLIICHNIIFYPLKMLWPANLSSHYTYPQPFAISNPKVFQGKSNFLVPFERTPLLRMWLRD